MTGAISGDSLLFVCSKWSRMSVSPWKEWMFAEIGYFLKLDGWCLIQVKPVLFWHMGILPRNRADRIRMIRLHGSSFSNFSD